MGKGNEKGMEGGMVGGGGEGVKSPIQFDWISVSVLMRAQNAQESESTEE